MKKHPDKLPVIMERGPKDRDLPMLEKPKFLVPKNLTVSQLLFIIRSRLKLSSEKALYIFINDMLPTGTSYISEVYNSYVDDDGFLYIMYCSENTFGK
jgi:GABA(A) receptor-associated protein